MATTYPPIIDTWSNKQDGIDLIRAADLNQAHERIIKIQEVLGVNPQAGFSTVANRIAAIEAPKPPFITVGLFFPENILPATLTPALSHEFI